MAVFAALMTVLIELGRGFCYNALINGARREAYAECRGGFIYHKHEKFQCDTAMSRNAS